MKIINKIVVSILAAGSLSGCIKETFPTNGATSGQVAESSTALAAMVSAIPTQLTLYAQNYSQSWDFGYPAQWISLDHMGGDIVIAGNAGYDWFQNWTYNIALSEDYVTGYQFWYNYYSWIKSCNDVISTLAAVDEEEMNADQKAYLGITMTFPAQFYLDMVRLFEAKECTGSQVKNYTIPDKIKGLSCCIVTENTTEEESKSNPRAKSSDIYT
ncbi:MAG: RagB/SusD family nutrient uptake outer membrane protein, partial [Alistipes sp.]|nr:RagB/SusD family nutrient uptake outer membrane protein [Alistipes sp.]